MYNLFILSQSTPVWILTLTSYVVTKGKDFDGRNPLQFGYASLTSLQKASQKNSKCRNPLQFGYSLCQNLKYYVQLIYFVAIHSSLDTHSDTLNKAYD